MPDTDRNKKILYVITRAERGGAQSHVASLCARAAEHGFTAELASGDGSGWLIDTAKILGMKTHRLKNLNRSWNPLQSLFLMFEVRSLVTSGKFDVVHLHSSNTLTAMPGIRLASPRPKTVFTLHGWSILHPGWQKSKWLKNLYSLTLRALLPLVDKVIFVSAADRDFGLRRKLVTEGSSSVIHNGIDESVVFLTRADARLKLGITGSEFVVGTIARFDYPKNLELLVEAALRLPHEGYKVLLVGDGPDKPALKELIADRDQGDRISIVDSLDKPLTCLPGFDCFVMCSRFEGLPYTLLEAGLAGVPIVATPVGGIPELIDRGQTGRLLSTGDPENLAKEIRFAHDNPEERQHNAAALKKKIVTSFTERGMAEKVFTEYEGLIRAPQ